MQPTRHGLNDLQAAMPQESPTDWPADQPRPGRMTLYEWLSRAFDKNLVRRFGNGRAKDPYRFRLPNEDDESYDRGELPPLKPLDFATMDRR